MAKVLAETSTNYTLIKVCEKSNKTVLSKRLFYIFNFFFSSKKRVFLKNGNFFVFEKMPYFLLFISKIKKNKMTTRTFNKCP